LGKHSAGDDRVFLRSLILSIAKWTVVAAVPALAALGVWKVVHLRTAADSPVVATSSPRPSATASSSPPDASPLPSPSPSSTQSPPSPAPAPHSGKLQVLNGTSTTGLALKAAQKLREAGFEIAATAPAAKSYPKTTIFYQPGKEQLARDVASVLGLGAIAPAPGNLDRSIPVTVVVGADYRP
jgi:LytR cell envelope-related transcriptional attenuator